MSVKIVRLSDSQRVWQATGSSVGLSGTRVLAADESLVNDGIKVGTLVQMWEGEHEDITEELIAQLSKAHGIPSKPKAVEAVELPADIVELQALLKNSEEVEKDLRDKVAVYEGEVSDLKLQLGNSEKAVSSLQSQLEEVSILKSALETANAQLLTEIEQGKRAVNEAKSTETVTAPAPTSKSKAAAAIPPLPNTEADA
jgi:hypothetical protein